MPTNTLTVHKDGTITGSVTFKKDKPIPISVEFPSNAIECDLRLTFDKFVSSTTATSAQATSRGTIKIGS
jgi:hypothetical protein